MTAARRTRRRLTGFVLVVALLCSCTSDPPEDDEQPAGSTQSVSVLPTEPAEVSDAGVTVSIPAGAVDSAGELSLGPAQSVPDGVAESLRLINVTHPVAVSLTDTELTGRATLTFPVPDGWEELTPVVAWENGEGGWHWLPTRVSEVDGERVATAETYHFSSGFLAAFDPREAAGDFVDGLKNLLTGRAGVGSPKCQGEAEARATLTVQSDSGDAVKWCMGMQDGAPVLKVANNRNTFAQVSVPLSSIVLSGDEWGLSVDNLVRVVGEGMERFAQAFPDDRRILLLKPGKTLTIALPTGETGGAQIVGSVTGYLLSILVDALDTFVLIAGGAGLKAATNGDKLLNLLGTGSGSRAEWAGAAFACLRNMTEIFTDELGAAPSGFESLQKSMEFAGKCGVEIGKVSIDDSGVLGWFVSASIAAVVSVVSLVYSLVTKLFAGIREVFDQTAYLFGSKSDPTYDVRTDPKVDTSLLGTNWYVHGGSLVINANSTAFSYGHGVCPDKWESGYETPWCNDVLEFTVEPTSSGATLTVVKSYIQRMDTNATAPPSKYGAEVGTTFTLERYHDDYLVTQSYAPDGEHLYPDSANGLGNPYLCAPGTSDPEQLCGA